MPDHNTGDENGRYHRQTLISWWEQDRLAAAKVLVVGAGALGNELVKNLALAGVGTVVVADMDTIENSNLSRCVFFRTSDEGRYKAEVVCEAARGLNPDASFHAVTGDIRNAVGLGSYRDFDVVLGGLDNREARLHVNQACWKAGKPWIDGAIEGLMGVVRVFVPPESACYECTMSERDHELLAARRTCALLTRDEMLDGKVPTTGTSASIIAGMQVQEAIKLLHADRLETSMAGKGFVVNGMNHDSYVVEYPRTETCMSHDTYALDQVGDADRDAPLREVLEYGAGVLGAPVNEVAIDFEQDIIVAFTCPTCGVADDPPVLLTKATAGSALCPTCGDERSLDVRHSLTAVDDEILAMTPGDLGIAPADILTIRTAEFRMHAMITDPHPWEIQDAELVEEVR